MIKNGKSFYYITYTERMMINMYNDLIVNV